MNPPGHPRPLTTRGFGVAALAATLLLHAPGAHASFLSGEALDSAANVIALFVIFVVPVVLIAVFWYVHVLPEKVAEAREHPQKEAINVLCLLSLVFGGLLWPLAWLWAYSKPVLHQMAYGRDKHEDYYARLAAEDPADARLLGEDVARLRAELDALAARGGLPDELRDVQGRLKAVEEHLATPARGGEAG
jgi:CBS domain containing-hemolysin-like protein